MRVLIVDDCELSAGMLAVVMEIYGHTVRQTRSLAAAVGVAPEFQPEMVLLTVGAPVSATEIDVAVWLRNEMDIEPQIFALCATPAELSDFEQSAFDRVFPRPVRFGQLKPFLDAAIPRSYAVGLGVHSR